MFWSTLAAPLIAAASNQKILSGQLDAATIQEQLLIKKCFYCYSEVGLKSIQPMNFISFIINLSLIYKLYKKSSEIGHGAASI